MSPSLRARRLETIKFLTQDETKRLFSVIRDKRDRALFLIAYRHGLRASEVGLLHVADLDLKKLRIMVHRVKGSLAGPAMYLAPCATRSASAKTNTLHGSTSCAVNTGCGRFVRRGVYVDDRRADR